MLLQLSVLLLATTGVSAQLTPRYPVANTWCGKVYEPGYEAPDPGGRTAQPTLIPGPPLLDVQFKPRYSLYLDSEKTGQFVVNAPLSQYFGKPLTNSTSTTTPSFNTSLIFTIRTNSSNTPLVVDRVAVNTTGNLFAFNLTGLTPSLSPIRVLLSGSPVDSNEIWNATTELYYLPEKGNGSVTKIDNLNGGMLFKNTASNKKFVPLLPYGFYSSFDGFLRNVTSNDSSVLNDYAQFGMNAITPLTNYDEGPAVFPFLDQMDLKFMFDMREFSTNLTMVREQVTRAKDAEAIFAYWSIDEGDGRGDPFSFTNAIYNLTKSLDPYHPVAVVLNCQNYNFGGYTQGADIIMEDTYPIGINSTFSKWGTACTPTIGDCGCDNCRGDVRDVADRLDDLARYEVWLNRWPKTKIHNPQSFHGEDYWFRDPTPDEEYVMSLLTLNHGGQGLISWIYPAATELDVAHGRLAKVVTVSPVVDFLVGATRPRKAAVSSESQVVDAAYWVVGQKILVSVANTGNETAAAISVPGAKSISSVPWGNSTAWMLSGETLSVAHFPHMATSLLILDTA